MCQACQKSNKITESVNSTDDKTILELQSAIECLTARAAEDARVINQLLWGAVIICTAIGAASILL